MIQQAHLGVGIKGREGSQAARAADFAVPQFRCLQKLLLVHGRYSLLRNTKVIYSAFYKNFVVFICIIWYSFFNGASGMPVYGDWIMTFYNIIFTSLPLLSLGIFEKDLREWIIEKNPEVYKEQKKLTFSSLVIWLANAVFHSLLIFWSVWSIFYLDGEILQNGTGSGFRYFGSVLITIAFHVALAKMLLETNHWVIWTGVAYGLSILGYYLFEVYESYYDSDEEGVFITVLQTPFLWFSAVLVVIASLMVDVVLKFIHRQDIPKPWYILQEKYGQQDQALIGKLRDDGRAKPLLHAESVTDSML